MNIDKNYLLINCGVAAVFGIITGKVIGYYTGKIEGFEEVIEEKAKINAELTKSIKEQNAKYTKVLVEKEEMIARLMKENNDFVEEVSDLETKLHYYMDKELEEKEKQEKIEEVKKAIEKKDWKTVYSKSERWYNDTPCDMSRAEVFTNLEKDGYVTREQILEAKDYFGNLWFYVGD